MPYIATDLDAFDDAQAVAGATGLPPPQALGGLALTWRWCWRNKSDRVTAEQLAAFFCSSAPGLPAALVAFGFLEAGDTYRVRGVDRYLRLSEARRRGGLAAKANLVPGARQRKKALGTSPEAAQKLPGITSGPDSALSAKVEGRRAKNDGKKLAGSAVAAPLDPREGGDATYKALVAALFVLFREHRGYDFEPDGKQWKALERLRGKHDGSEIIRRWGHGVRAAFKAKCSCFTDLEAKWNDCGAPEAAGGFQKAPPDVNGGIMTRERMGSEEWEAERAREAAEEQRRLESARLRESQKGIVVLE